MSVRRIFVILFSFVFGVSLISAPMVAAAPAVDSPLMDEGPLDQTGSETFIAAGEKPRMFFPASCAKRFRKNSAR